MKKVSIFATVLVLFFGNVGNASQIKKEGSLNNTFLVKNSSLEKNMSRRAKRNVGEDLNTYTKVVNSYIYANGRFQNLSLEDQAAFTTAAEKLETRLATTRKGKNLAKKVAATKKVYQFIWDSKKVDQVQEILLPNTDFTRTLGR